MKITTLDDKKLKINYEDHPTKPYIYITVNTIDEIKKKVIKNMDGWFVEQPKEVEEDFDDALFNGSLDSAAKISKAIYKNANELITCDDIKLFLADNIIMAEEYINRNYYTMTFREKMVFENAVLRLVSAELWGKFNIPQVNNIQEGLISTPRANYLEKTGLNQLKRLIREKLVAI